MQKITKYESLTDEELYTLAKELRVEIKKDAKRDDVERLVYEAQVKIEGKSTKKNSAGLDEMVTLKYIGKGTVTKFKKKWSGKKQSLVTEREARVLLHTFPKRFVRVSNKEDKK
jgi:hypothetical protein